MQHFFALLLVVQTLFSSSFLMPDEAFKPSAKLNASMNIEVDINIADEIYLYEDRVKIELINPKNITIKEIKLPLSVMHDGDKVYMDTPHVEVVLQNSNGFSGSEKVELKVSFQGCSEQGLCYEPMDKIYSFEIDSSKIVASTTPALKSLNFPTIAEVKKKKEVKVVVEEEISQTDYIANTIGSENILIILLTFLGFGLALSLTPCLFPMIPIISGLIISQGDGLSTKKAFFLSLVYVLAMSIAYTIAGVLAGLFGSNLQSALQTPWVIYSFSGVFVALAFSMFGFYELKLPDSLVSRVSSKGGSGVVGIAIMGFLSALIVGPCVAAPLAGALVYIGQTGDAILGGMALFAMGIGMGIPLIVVGVSAGKFMPKPGMWMTLVSAIFGIVMLGVAIWMLERIVSPYITMILYSMLGIGSAIYLGALESSGHIFKKSISLILFIYSIALFIGALGGSQSMSRPLEFLTPKLSASVDETSKHKFEVVTSIDALDILLEKNRGKKIVLDFSAEWCASCKELEEVTFKDSHVKAKMSEFIFIQADITKDEESEKALSKKYGVFGPPALLFFDENSKLQKSKTIIGFIEPKEFLEHLEGL